MRLAFSAICALGMAVTTGVASAADKDHEFLLTATGSAESNNDGALVVLDSKGVPVPGSPFNPNVEYSPPVGTTPTEGPMGPPVKMTLTPSGDYLYVLYDSQEGGSGLASFDMTTGKPKLLSSIPGVVNGTSSAEILLTAHNGFVFTTQFSRDPGGTHLGILKAPHGELTFHAYVTLGTGNITGGGINLPLSLQVDDDLHYAYVTYNSADNEVAYGTCTATQCVAIYDISRVPAAPSGPPAAPVLGVLVSTMPYEGNFLVGHSH